MKKILIISAWCILIVLSACTQQKQAPMNELALSKQWQLFSSETANISGDIISTMDYTPENFLEAIVPSTVFNTHVKNKVYENVYFGNNLEQISPKPFQKAWWYRNVFEVNSKDSQYELQFDGINYKANIWLNGKLIADTNTVNNAFKMYRFEVSEAISLGENILALEVFPPTAGDFSIGFVDWNPAPPDQNMGIFRPAKLNTINKVQITEAHIENSFQNNDYSLAYQNASLKLKNFSDQKISGSLEIVINGLTIKKEIQIPAKATKKVVLRPENYSELMVKNPELWWPHTLGESILHEARFSFTQKDEKLCESKIKYGIREIRDYYTPEGHRGFTINGEKISIRGGGWVDDLMLDNTHNYDLAQLEYVKSMNLNTVRMEGFWGKDNHLYQTCDELGILVMIGWSCHWEWENYLGKYCDEKYGGILSDEDINLMSAAWEDQIIWLRNHPSIIAWFSGSDCVPTPALEQKYLKTFETYDSSRIYLSSAKEWESSNIQSGMKMRGPYAYVPPVYWFSDTLYGGAFGFNTETGPGAQVPPLESIKKMIPENKLWPPDNATWDFHCGRNEFNTLLRYNTALYERYGKPKSIEEYAQKAQLLNYELMRPMFEAFSARRYEATGLIQWMLNSAWPEMYWQLYDSYLMPNGAFYATKKAGEPLHALYDYDENAVYLVNDRLIEEKNIQVNIRIYNIESEEIYATRIQTDITKNSSQKILELPELINLSESYFLDLRVEKEGNELGNNFYWLSTKKDILDYEAEVPNWYYHTPSKSYANFDQLNHMKKAKVSHSLSIEKYEEHTVFNIEIKNDSPVISFFMDLKIRDLETQESILPVIWSDNYISLLPGEQRTLTVKIKNQYLDGKNPELTVDGFNL